MGPDKMYRDTAVCGRAVRVFVRERYGSLRAVKKTAFFTAGLYLSSGVDHSLHIDGDRFLADMDFRSGEAGYLLRVNGLWQAAVCKFFLACVFL